jgi:alpha/beta superfamily hydrolase
MSDTTHASFPCATTLKLSGPVGALEAVTSCPSDPESVKATAVICHPHPVQGGTMHNKVVYTLARSLNDLGLRTVRFNFRGVGASEGSFANGEGETDDALAVIDWVRGLRPQDEIWLAGFSFGGYVATRAASQRPVSQLVTIAPAVHLYDFARLSRPPAPWLVVQGDADDVVSVDAVRVWAAQVQPPPDLVVLEGVDHFFHRRLHDLRQVLGERLAPRVPGIN